MGVLILFPFNKEMIQLIHTELLLLFCFVCFFSSHHKLSVSLSFSYSSLYLTDAPFKTCFFSLSLLMQMSDMDQCNCGFIFWMIIHLRNVLQSSLFVIRCCIDFDSAANCLCVACPFLGHHVGDKVVLHTESIVFTQFGMSRWVRIIVIENNKLIKG